MNIKFYGQACFSIEDAGIKVVTDPFSGDIGLKVPELSANVVVVSHDAPAYNNVASVGGDPKVFNCPGEYETKGVHFKMIHSFHNAREDEEQLENTITVIFFNGIRLCHLGAQGTKLTPEQLESVGDVDILFLPVGGKTVIEGKKSKEVIEQIEPRVVIPMIYHTEGNNLELGNLQAFLSEMGASTEEPVDAFTVKRSELPEDNSKVVVINPTT